MSLGPIHGVFHVDVKKVTWCAIKDTPVTFAISLHILVGGEGQSMRIHKILSCNGVQDLVLTEDDPRFVQTSITLDPAKSIAPGVLAKVGKGEQSPLRIALVCSHRKGKDGEEVKRETSFVDLRQCTPGSVTLVKIDFMERGWFHKSRRLGEVKLFLRWHTLQDTMTHRLSQLQQLLTGPLLCNMFPHSWALASAVVPAAAGADVPASDEALKKLNDLHRSLVGLSRYTFSTAYREQLALERGAGKAVDTSSENLWAVEESSFMQQCYDAAAVCRTAQQVSEAMRAAASSELRSKVESAITSMLERHCKLNVIVSNISSFDVRSGVLGDALQRFSRLWATRCSRFHFVAPLQ